MNDYICDYVDCCGCGACSQICPGHCIEMKPDAIEGFLYPEVNLEKCVHCSACKRVCPCLNVKPQVETVTECYVGYNRNNKDRVNSSSGAIFPLLAERIIEEEGTVFGAVFSEDRRTVYHTSADNMQALKALYKSKYIQSDTNSTFVEVKKLLNSGKTVLYSGTACQINGLRTFLGKEYDNLYMVDVLCHGVASPAMYNRILMHLEAKHRSTVTEVDFRNKYIGWKKFFFHTWFQNNTEYKKQFAHSIFGEFFVNNICLRENCYTCKFKDGNHGSDITIGDAWGIDRFMPDMYDDKGASVIIVHSSKGERLLNCIRDDMVIRHSSMQKALADNSFYYKPVNRNQHRDIYLEGLKNGTPVPELLKLVHVGFFGKVVRKVKRIIIAEKVKVEDQWNNKSKIGNMGGVKTQKYWSSHFCTTTTATAA